MRLWDAETGADKVLMRGHSAGVHRVAFSPDGRRIVSSSDDTTVRLWDVATGQEVLALRGHADQVVDVNFSPDGNTIASAGADRTLKIWDATPLSPELVVSSQGQSTRRVAPRQVVAHPGSTRTHPPRRHAERARACVCA